VKMLGVLLSTISAPLRRWNVRLVLWMLVALVVMVLVYSAIFHQLMALEGQRFSWPASIYWTLTTMSTLGYGDITFDNDLGRLFSVLVLLSGRPSSSSSCPSPSSSSSSPRGSSSGSPPAPRGSWPTTCAGTWC
jgi:hypothetical protein